MDNETTGPFIVGFCRPLLPDHSGEWAVLRDEQVIGLYATLDEALQVGATEHVDGRFSIQEVKEEQPIDLGWFSHVL